MEGLRQARIMSEDLRNSLIAWFSVLFWTAFAIIMFRLADGLAVPDWVLPVGGVMTAIEFGGRYYQSKRRRGSDR